MTAVPTCEWCGQPFADVPGCTAKEAAHTQPHDGHDRGAPCRDCAVEPGHQHHPGCCIAICDTPGEHPQQLLCGCQFCEPVSGMIELAFLAEAMADPTNPAWDIPIGDES